MGKKKTKTKVPEKKKFLESDYNLAGTPEGEKIVKSLENPFGLSLALSILTIVVGVAVAIIPFARHADPQDPLMVLAYLGVICAVIGVIYLITFIRKVVAFHKFKNQKHLIIWKYTDEDYRRFAQDMDSLVARPSRRQSIFVIICIVVLEIVMFFMSPADGKWVIYLSAILLFGSVIGIMYLAPRYYMERIYKKPYVSVIDINSAYVMGKFITWKYGTGHLKKFPEECKTKGLALCIDYDGYRFGSKTVLEYSALLPSADEATMDEALRVAKKITAYSKEYAEFKKNSGDALERVFKKSVGQDVPTFDPKNKL